MTDNDLPPLPQSKAHKLREAFTRDDVRAYARADPDTLLLHIVEQQAEIDQLVAARDARDKEIERLRACIAEVREQAKEKCAHRGVVSSALVAGMRTQARCTLAILDRHAADGGGDA